jgi:hypothetical protein
MTTMIYDEFWFQKLKNKKKDLFGGWPLSSPAQPKPIEIWVGGR